MDLGVASIQYSEEDGPNAALNTAEENLMAETVKKAKAPAKPRKTTTSGKTTEIRKAAEVRPVTHEEIASLAHRYWAERGHPHGQAELDWYRAEQELRGKAS